MWGLATASPCSSKDVCLLPPANCPCCAHLSHAFRPIPHQSLVWGVCRQLQGLFDGTIWGPAAAAAAPAVPFVTALGAVVQAGLALRPEERCSFEELWEAAHCENETAKLFAARAP